eukprot:TRINITY_DN4369_c0_g1_i1.p1 TRINITY_DN4369_c0_g1~~TRINITY_DN4369_c0_g1_i1.p1  ORF type:complete len:953 (+),score=187.97 TRINITY_DN4369_c0_g1_i1:64-2859(+)
MAAPTPQEFLQQLAVSNGERTAKPLREQALAWLQDCRRHPQAWHVFHAVLSNGNPHVPQERAVQADGWIFAAQSLRWRVGKEMPTGQLAAELRQTVVVLLRRFSEGPRAVRTQLCLAFIKLLSVDLQGPPSAFSDACAQLSAPDTARALIALLHTFGEEAASRRRRKKTSAARHHLVAIAESSGAGVIGLLHQLWEANQDEVWRRDVLACYGEWVRFSGESLLQLSASPLTQAAVQGLAQPQLSTESGEVLCELATASESDLAKHAAIVGLLTSQLPTLWELMQQATKAQDDDESALYCRTMSSIATSYAPLIAQGTDHAIQMIRFLICATRHPVREVAENVLTFWYRLPEAIAQGVDPVEAERRRQVLAPAVADLVDALVELGQTPAEADGGSWAVRDDHSLREWRRNVYAEAVKSCGTCLTPRVAAHRAFVKLGPASQSPRWRDTEGVLVFLRYLDIPPDVADEMLPQLFASFQAFAGHWRVRAALTYLFGKFGRWLDANGEAVMPALMTYVTQSCQDPTAAPFAVEAVRQLCQQCSRRMLSQFQNLLMLCEASHCLKIEDQELLLHGLGTLICGLDEVNLRSAISTLWGSALQRIRGTAEDVELELRRLVALSRGATEGTERVEKEGGPAARQALGRVWAQSFSGLWPVLQNIMATLNCDPVMEQLTSLLRQVLKTCDVEFRPHLEVVSGILVGIFQRTPWSCIPWVTGTIIGVFGSDPLCVQPLLGVMTALAGTTMEFLSSNPMGPNSDLVQEIFYLFQRAACRFMVDLLRAPVTAQVFELGVAAIRCTDLKSNAFTGVLEFYETLLGGDDQEWRDATEPAAVVEFLRTGPPAQPARGQVLVTACLQSVVERDLHSSDAVGVILFYLARNGEQCTWEWVHGGLASLPPEVPPEARELCIAELRKKTTKGWFQDALEDLHASLPKNWK